MDTGQPVAAQVVVGFTIALAVALFGFWKCPNVGWMQGLSIASVGAALYGAPPPPPAPADVQTLWHLAQLATAATARC